MKKKFSINDMTVRNKITLFSVLMLGLMLRSEEHTSELQSQR